MTITDAIATARAAPLEGYFDSMLVNAPELLHASAAEWGD
jgi:hypothetical protein